MCCLYHGHIWTAINHNDLQHKDWPWLWSQVLDLWLSSLPSITYCKAVDIYPPILLHLCPVLYLRQSTYPRIIYLRIYKLISSPSICVFWPLPLTSDRSCFSFPVRLSLCPESFFMLPSDPLSWFFIIRSSRACTSFSKAAIRESYKTRSPLGSYNKDVHLQACNFIHWSIHNGY